VFLVPIVDRLERRGMGRTGATIVVIAVTVVVVVLLFFLFLTVLVEQGARLVREWPIYQAQLQSGYQAADIPPQVRSAIDAVLDTLHENRTGADEGTAILGFVQGVLGLAGTVFAFFILPFFTFYLVKDQPRMAASFDASIPGPWREDVRATLDVQPTHVGRHRSPHLETAGPRAAVSLESGDVRWLAPPDNRQETAPASLTSAERRNGEERS
jgi:predicted PurR-regulated permease PerM